MKERNNASPRDIDRLASQPNRGREAEEPAEIPPEGWKDVLWRVYRSINEDRVLLASAGTTFYLLMALVPTLSAFVSIYGLFNDRANVLDQVRLLYGIVPPGGIEIIEEQLTRLTGTEDAALSWTLVLSLAVALWSSSAGIKALFEAMNIAYGETEKRNFFVLNALALLFTLLAALGAALALGVVVLLPGILALLRLGEGFEWLLRLAGYGVMLSVMVAGLAALYRWGPSREQAKWRWITPGTILTVVLTIAVSLLFSWYVASFGNYNATYGSLGALIGLLTWVWLSVTILIIGGELNSEVEHQTARDSTTGAPLPIGARGAHMADTIGEVAPGSRTKVRSPEAFAGDLRVRRPFSAGTLALAVPAALLLSALRRHAGGKR